MTTPTNEEVRRQFEAWHDTKWPKPREYEPFHWKVLWKRERAERFETYQAALSSPAVVALVEADKEYDEAAQAFTNARPYTDEAIAALERVEAVSAKRHAAIAALAPFTTGAGHVE